MHIYIYGYLEAISIRKIEYTTFFAWARHSALRVLHHLLQPPL